MIAEQINIDINIDLLRDEIIQKITGMPIVSRSAAIGGWALQSTNRLYSDGWGTEFNPYNGPNNYAPEFNPTNIKQKKLISIQKYVLPTEVTTPYLDFVLKKLESLGLNPRKARVIRLTENSNCSWHQDGVKEYYQVRLHIPLVTNPSCFFETQEGRIHMEYGGVYLVHVNKPHRITNGGDSARFHFVCHIWDQKCLSQFHKYIPTENVGSSYLPEQLID